MLLKVIINLCLIQNYLIKNFKYIYFLKIILNSFSFIVSSYYYFITISLVFITLINLYYFDIGLNYFSFKYH